MISLRQALLMLSISAAIAGFFELILLCRGRRRTIPGYGWETEISHLIMNVVMAMMMTDLWGSVTARVSIVLLAGAALILIVTVMLRPYKVDQQNIIRAAVTIHVCSVLLMAWLVMRMARLVGEAMPMDMSGTASRSSWIQWAIASFYLFDLASVFVITMFAKRFPSNLRSTAPRISLLPHIAMDISMMAMLVLL